MGQRRKIYERQDLPQSKSDPDFKVCGAWRNDKQCGQTAGWGTDHYGYGECKLHGGAMRNNRIAAAKEEAMDVARSVMGPALDIEPMEALLLCVRIAAGEVAYSTYKIEQLSDEEALVLPETVTERDATGEHAESYVEKTVTNAASLNVWIIARGQATDRLARYSKMALDAGIAERQVRVAEQAGDELALAIRAILDGLGLSVEQEKRAPDLVRRALQQLEQKTGADLEPVTA